MCISEQVTHQYMLYFLIYYKLTSSGKWHSFTFNQIDKIRKTDGIYKIISKVGTTSCRWKTRR